MRILRSIALGAALFGVGLALQQLTLNMLFYHAGDSLLPVSLEISEAKQRAKLKYREHLNKITEAELGDALEEVEDAFAEKKIGNASRLADARKGALVSQRQNLIIAPLGAILQVVGSFIWFLALLKVMRSPSPSLREQVCAITIGILLVMTAMLNQSAFSVVQNTVVGQGGLLQQQLLDRVPEEPPAREIELPTRLLRERGGLPRPGGGFE